MTKSSSFFAVVLLLLLAPGILSATAVPVGQLWFVNDGIDQHFWLFNDTFNSGGVKQALSFDDLSLTVTFADKAQKTQAAGVSFQPGAFFEGDPGTNNWRWLTAENGLITSATLTGRIKPTSFDVEGMPGIFSSNGILSANLDLSGNSLTGFDLPATITVSDNSAPAPVPEPSTIVLLAGPAFAFLVRRIRK